MEEDFQSITEASSASNIQSTLTIIHDFGLKHNGSAYIDFCLRRSTHRHVKDMCLYQECNVFLSWVKSVGKVENDSLVTFEVL